ncbi:DNA phosphorothioation-dependent restriction protein DptG [Marinobacter guineae]|uniref:DNA phosphorothioation-dependent restriction protein DptG n=1 Tax=Marinobacter guineae TaxID=432303 RepID=A0A2G1VH32_9GAMM|nr:DNA phosphorothioation-dependent restriction protein DptG [Marinobacter guineae]PHQ26076.1 DNA phosphorothioation-dependent restriction protein DptG [Marinobacter guineae]
MTVAENLAELDEQEVQERNLVNTFLPFRQQRSNTAGYDFDAIAGSVLATALQKQLTKGSTIESFRDAVFARLAPKLTDDSINGLIETMYFEGNASGLFKVSPEFLIFKTIQADVSTNKHISQVLTNFILNERTEFPRLSSDVNFLEKELVEEFQKFLTNSSNEPTEHPYLPFLSKLFSEDLRFLLEHPTYFLQNLSLFFNLYNFLYSAQLALNVNGWTETPDSKPLFFILDTEKASLERKQVGEAFDQLIVKVADLFPVLSMLEYLNQPQNKKAKKFPLWRVFQDIDAMPELQKLEVRNSLEAFCKRYREKRSLEALDGYAATVKGMFGHLSETAKEIFSRRGTNQFTVNSKFVNAFEYEVASHFIQVRGRSGRVLTVSQDYLLLLTNLSIGDRKQIQFQELLSEFKKRGVWFDRQSEQAIIRFLERIGNVERMSDSGDAVYVRKTL